MTMPSVVSFFFFFNDTATTEIYTLSLHDALPISTAICSAAPTCLSCSTARTPPFTPYETKPAALSPHSTKRWSRRSEEHTSELQSPCNLVCRLLLEKKKKKSNQLNPTQRNKQSRY